MSRSELYAKAVQLYLEDLGEEGVTEKLNEVYADMSSSLDPRLAQLQAESIKQDEW